MFKLASLTVDAIYGGTAGSWNKDIPKLDEYELMVIAHRPGPA